MFADVITNFNAKLDLVFIEGFIQQSKNEGYTALELQDVFVTYTFVAATRLAYCIETPTIGN
jgi:hypothetical protein